MENSERPDSSDQEEEEYEEIEIEIESDEEPQQQPAEPSRNPNSSPQPATQNYASPSSKPEPSTEDSRNLIDGIEPAAQESTNPPTTIDPTIVMLEQLATALGVLRNQTETSLSMQNSIRWDAIKLHFQKLDVSFNARAEGLDRRKMELEQKRAHAQLIIKEKEEKIREKERESWNRLQVVKDEAVSLIREARQKHKSDVSDLIYGRNKKSKTVVKISDENAPVSHVLKQIFENMNSRGLVQFIVENYKKINGIKEQFACALRSAPEPDRLVLDTVELGFWYRSDEMVEEESENDKNALVCIRKCCIAFMEVFNNGGFIVNCEVSARAGEILSSWKESLAGLDLDSHSGYSVEAQGTLQLIVTFNVGGVFDEDDLCRLAVAISQRKQTAEICRSIRLHERIPGIVEELISKKRPIDAVHFIQAFNLGERFSVVSILMSHLEHPQDVCENDGDKLISASQDPVTKELNALRIVIKVAEEYKLQKQLAIGPLQKRIMELKTGPSKRPSSDPPYPKPPKKRGPMYPNSAYSSGRPGAPAVNSAAYSDTYNQYPAAAYNTAYPQYPPPAEVAIPSSTQYSTSALSYYGSYCSGYGSGFADPVMAQAAQPAPVSSYASYHSAAPVVPASNYSSYATAAHVTQPSPASNYASYPSAAYAPPPAQHSYM